MFVRHMRMPAASFVTLLVLLCGTVGLGAWQPFRLAYVAEVAITMCMVLVVLLVSMEVLREPPLVRVFAGLGFFWVMILFGMTTVDYLSR